MRYYDIIPLKNVPHPHPQCFTYACPDKLQGLSSGQLVEIPFRSSIIRGVVRSESGIPAFSGSKVRSVIRAPLPGPLLTSYQLALAEKISRYYHVSLGLVIDAFVPEIPKRASAPESGPAAGKNARPGLEKHLLLGGRERTDEALFSMLRDCLDAGNQAICVLPGLASVREAVDRISAAFPKARIAEFHSQVSYGRYFEDWMRALSGGIDIMIGTRMAALAPAARLGLIAIALEHDPSHKQWDMNPRYDARTLAEWRSELEECKLVFMSPAPTVARYHSFKSLSLPIERFSTMPQREQITIASLDGQTGIPKARTLSQASFSAIERALSFQKQALVIVPRRGYSSAVACQDCTALLRCVSCSNPPAEAPGGSLYCLSCGKKSAYPAVCPSCGSARFKGKGAGADKYYAELREAFPGKAIVLADSDTAGKKGLLDDIYKGFDTGKIDILVGTPFSAAWNPFNIGCVVIAAFDSLLSIPGYNASERAYSFLSEILSGFKSSEVVIETRQPDHPSLKLALSGAYELMYDQEIEIRRQLAYPPFARLFKLICRAPDENALAREEKALISGFAILKKTLGKEAQLYCELFGPVRPRAKASGNRPVGIFILKTDLGLWVPNEGRLKVFFEKISSKWIVDVDPENII